MFEQLMCRYIAEQYYQTISPTLQWNTGTHSLFVVPDSNRVIFRFQKTPGPLSHMPFLRHARPSLGCVRISNKKGWFVLSAFVQVTKTIPFLLCWRYTQHQMESAAVLPFNSFPRQGWVSDSITHIFPALPETRLRRSEYILHASSKYFLRVQMCCKSFLRHKNAAAGFFNLLLLWCDMGAGVSKFGKGKLSFNSDGKAKKRAKTAKGFR